MEHNPYTSSRIVWDLNTKKTMISGGNYARMIQLQDNTLLGVAEANGGISIARSTNMGETWGASQRIAAHREKLNLCVPDVIQLRDGTILVGYNPRPTQPYSEDRKFGSRVKRSTDNGYTWSDEINIFDARHYFTAGCWEPVFLEMPSGEVQCYFANENDFPDSHDQTISMCRSFDKGVTWSEPTVVSYRPGARDGMPAPILLNDEIVVIIEDNGWPGRNDFMATTVRTKIADNWYGGHVPAVSDNRNYIFETMPPVSMNSAAPYLRKLPWGETVASFQSNENRPSGGEYVNLGIVIGDTNAKNFKAKSYPFSISEYQHAIWNSVSVIDTGVIVAVASIGLANSANDAVIMKGYPIRKAKASFSNIIVDGVKTSSDETWTTKTGEQLFFGAENNNRWTTDFAYDNEYLYLRARVVDKEIISGTTRNDGLRFLIDTDNICGSLPQKGMYNFFFDTNGAITLQTGDNGSWVTSNDIHDILYALNIKSSYYDLEVGIPWSLFGRSTPITTNRMAIALELFNRSSKDYYMDLMPEVNKSASSTWLEFQLESSTETSIIETSKAKDDVRVFVVDNRITIDSLQVPIISASFFDFEGKMVLKQQINANTATLSALQQNGVLKLELDNGSIYTQKIFLR